MDAARRLDEQLGTRGAFAELCRHITRCATILGGLNGSGIFFVIVDGQVFQQAFRVGVDDGVLTRYVDRVKTMEGFQGHGILAGAFVGGADSVIMQFCANDESKHISFKCVVGTETVEVDDTNYAWPS